MPTPTEPEPILVPSPVDPNRLGVVFFDLPGDRLPAVAADLRRLSGKPQLFRWLPTVEEEPGRVLVRIESPPPLVVERLLGGPSPVIAYIEQDPAIWVQVGYRCPDPEQFRPIAGRWVLIRPDGPEEILAGEFGGEIESLTLLAHPEPAQSSENTVPAVRPRLRLATANHDEPATLWVLREDALTQLTAYCRVTHQHLLARFTVAVSASAGVPCVVLRALTTKGPPPLFVGPAVSYVQALKLSNVFLPTGTRLTPKLRRDALRTALRVQPDRVHWLHPLGDGGFRVESLPEMTFRPLTDWIEFRAPPSVVRTNTWIQSHRWELESFVERPPKTRPSPVVVPQPRRAEPVPDRPRLARRALRWLKRFRRSRRPAPVEELIPELPNVPVEEALRTALNQGDRLHHARPEAVSSALERCQTLEARFLQTLPGPAADSPPERWAELAAAYDAAGNHPDAALCWLNALWGQSNPSPLWAWGWLRAEGRAGRPEVKAIDPVPWLATTPGPGTTRAMAAWVVWASLQSPPPATLADRVAELQARLEAHEHWLPVRGAWLSRTALARIGRGDVLGLARTRDRLAERLLATGLSLELDTPSFLRFAGEGVRERFQEARRWLADRRDLIRQWLARRPADAWVRADPADGPGPLRYVGLEPDVAHTQAYADLTLAWGLSRFAEQTTADAIRRQATAALPADDPAHAALRDAFEFRIAQVREGKPPRGPLPAPLRARIEALTGVARYSVDKLREHSRVLEPSATVESYRVTVFRKLEATTAADVIAALAPDRLDEEAPRLIGFESARPGRAHLAPAVIAALVRATELTEAGVDPVFAALPAALDRAWDNPRLHARLMELGLATSGHWDRADVASELAGRFVRLAGETTRWDFVESMIGLAARTLRRVGLPGDSARLLDHIAEGVHRGQPLGRVRTDRPDDWPAALRVLLHAAAGWYATGRDEPAHAVLDEARRDLFAAETTPANRTALAFAYAATLGQAPVRVALGRLEEMFQRLAGIQVGGTTNAYYSLKPLLLVETAVRAVVSDEFALGPQVRAWLDADELAVRRRIRDDLKAVLAAQGL
jgi:cellulose synthase operon protein C